MPRTLAQKFIEEHYIQKGLTVSILVLPAVETNLPECYVSDETPVKIDILANRPVNLTMNDKGLSVDLCFAGPPIRCDFAWHHILMVSCGEVVIATTVLVPKVLMETDLLPPTKEPQKEGFKPLLRRIK